MLKITSILALIFIVSSVWSACDSCGSECSSACGTRRFRTCCFNYLRKKRGPDDFKIIHSLAQDVKASHPTSEVPVLVVDNVPIPEQWTTDVLSSGKHPYSLEVILENRLD